MSSIDGVRSQPTHMAYSDEAYTTDACYRSVAVISFQATCEADLNDQIKQLLSESGLSEFKWTKLRQARERFAALKLIDLAVKYATLGELRIDVLVWDTQDSRHNIQGRDDAQNMQRMYYHLFKNVLRQRWPPESLWKLHPDENSALDWNRVRGFLNKARVLKPDSEPQISIDLYEYLVFDFHVVEISEVCSSDAYIAQLADLFAGMGPYSYSNFELYKQWEADQSPQMSFLTQPQSVQPLSNRDKERCLVISHLVTTCKRYKLGVGIQTGKGLRTFSPLNPINFWFYIPQHEEDKAPTKS